ncbi:MAG: hypothetical protein RL487_683 [Actinomycetota bacterium]|jgi:hypothetical protein
MMTHRRRAAISADCERGENSAGVRPFGLTPATLERSAHQLQVGTPFVDSTAVAPVFQ